MTETSGAEVVAWEYRYRFFDGAPWGWWQSLPTKEDRDSRAKQLLADDWLVEQRDLVDATAYQSLMAERDRLAVESRVKSRAVDRWVPCPDHRDKTDDAGCYVCRLEQLQSTHAALLGKVRGLIPRIEAKLMYADITPEKLRLVDELRSIDGVGREE